MVIHTSHDGWPVATGLTKSSHHYMVFGTRPAGLGAKHKPSPPTQLWACARCTMSFCQIRCLQCSFWSSSSMKITLSGYVRNILSGEKCEEMCTNDGSCTSSNCWIRRSLTFVVDSLTFTIETPHKWNPSYHCQRSIAWDSMAVTLMAVG